MVPASSASGARSSNRSIARQPPLDDGGKLGAPKPPGDRIRIAAGRAGTRRSLRRVYAQQPGKRVAASRQQVLLQQGPR